MGTYLSLIQCGINDTGQKRPNSLTCQEVRVTALLPVALNIMETHRKWPVSKISLIQNSISKYLGHTVQHEGFHPISHGCRCSYYVYNHLTSLDSRTSVT